jgi:Integral membrane protein TerC family.
MSILLQQENILSLLSLTVMEIVLGIDNIIFILASSWDSCHMRLGSEHAFWG